MSPAGQLPPPVRGLDHPLDLLVRWALRRPHCDAWLALPDEPPLRSSALFLMLRQAVLRVGEDPEHLSSHSLRIGAHTEQVLLGVPLEVRKARFGWAPKSPMEAVYFDRSIPMSPDSAWFFGP